MIDCPNVRRKRNGVPILSKEEIDCYAEKILYDYNPSSLLVPQETDIEDLAENYLGYNMDFQFLSHNGIYLGMMVFNDTDKVVIYSPETQKAEYIHADAGTIIIDNNLLEDNQKRRYKYTVGHEIGHGIYHTGYYCYNPDQITFTEYEHEPMVKCRQDAGARQRPKKGELVTDNDWMEWQANYTSAALCMPRKAVEIIARDCGFPNGSCNQKQLQTELVNTFGVSAQAAANRMKEFDYVTSNIKLFMSSQNWQYD